MIVIQSIVSILVIAVVLLQHESSGSFALGSPTSSYSAKRGVERLLFMVTIALSIAFIVLSIVALTLS